MVPAIGNLCCCSSVDEELWADSNRFGYDSTTILILDGSLFALLAPSLKSFIVCSSWSNGPNPAMGSQPSAYLTILDNVFGLNPPRITGGYGFCTGLGPILDA